MLQSTEVPEPSASLLAKLTILIEFQTMTATQAAVVLRLLIIELPQNARILLKGQQGL